MNLLEYLIRLPEEIVFQSLTRTIRCDFDEISSMIYYGNEEMDDKGLHRLHVLIDKYRFFSHPFGFVFLPGDCKKDIIMSLRKWNFC